MLLTIIISRVGIPSFYLLLLIPSKYPFRNIKLYNVYIDLYRCQFNYINVGATGRNNDSSIFENSMLKKIHEGPIFRENSVNIEGVSVPVLLIGDSAFRLSHIVQKPFRYVSNQNRVEQKFNYQLSKCRRVIENAFGQLKARFRRIGKGLEVRIDNAYKIVQACCVLHNFCIKERDMPCNSWMENDISCSHQSHPHSITVRGNRDARGVDIRNALSIYFSKYIFYPFLHIHISSFLRRFPH